MAVTTVSGGYFPNKDISHKPKRMQSEVANEIASVTTVDGTPEIHMNVPQSCTLESAISYYESHAKGEYAKLYKRTALWLRELLSSKQKRKSQYADTQTLNSAT